MKNSVLKLLIVIIIILPLIPIIMLITLFKILFGKIDGNILAADKPH